MFSRKDIISSTSAAFAALVVTGSTGFFSSSGKAVMKVVEGKMIQNLLLQLQRYRYSIVTVREKLRIMKNNIIEEKN
jgi:23S rRNA U2552 (ribose-2'-O)-methylase RlmE/FtsJ